MNGGNALARVASGNEQLCPILRGAGPRDVIAELAAPGGAASCFFLGSVHNADYGSRSPHADRSF